MTAWSEARSAMVGAHNELNDVKLRIGVRTKMIGVEDKPKEAPASADLREVGLRYIAIV